MAAPSSQSVYSSDEIVKVLWIVLHNEMPILTLQQVKNAGDTA